MSDKKLVDEEQEKVAGGNPEDGPNFDPAPDLNFDNDRLIRYTCLRQRPISKPGNDDILGKK